MRSCGENISMHGFNGGNQHELAAPPRKLDAEGFTFLLSSSVFYDFSPRAWIWLEGRRWQWYTGRSWQKQKGG